MIFNLFNQGPVISFGLNYCRVYMLSRTIHCTLYWMRNQ